jgi:hypothetical protein
VAVPQGRPGVGVGAGAVVVVEDDGGLEAVDGAAEGGALCAGAARGDVVVLHPAATTTAVRQRAAVSPRAGA